MKCCFCKKDAGEYGNNANPIMDARCCDACNEEKVIPFRLMKMHEHFRSTHPDHFEMMIQGDFTEEDLVKLGKFLVTNWKGRKEHINVGIRKGLHKKSIDETLKILQEMWK